uniref:Uncharacterized protein n=1 Tax=Paramormyrops kingsleyae TaxID=1676925 RepID=A0A3B3T7C5_9TELE
KLEVTGARARPDRCGNPPSAAVSNNVTSCSFSRSNSFSNTNSPYFPPTVLEFTSRMK